MCLFSRVKRGARFADLMVRIGICLSGCAQAGFCAIKKVLVYSMRVVL